MIAQWYKLELAQSGDDMLRDIRGGHYGKGPTLSDIPLEVAKVVVAALNGAHNHAYASGYRDAWREAAEKFRDLSEEVRADTPLE